MKKQFLISYPTSFNNIASKTGMDFGNLMVTLTNLELKGCIKQTDGEKYMSAINIG